MAMPGYAVLSHTWGPDEDKVRYHETADTHQHVALQSSPRPGHAKIRSFCRTVAQVYGLEYGWVDTYCNAAACFFWLADVMTREDVLQSRWFARSRTLQELLAPPRRVDFYNRAWTQLGDRNSLEREISRRDADSRAGSNLC
ncbi:Heterokaryon incompatibility [Moelleriella libera RCEF 2490]|uniref:Heterokaryon incompatibility n=1 Tax=Moelleriella libera RCEF 2490 TaxID=1081109 RepID=A0A168ANP8_9HYPO|nr:Heterokaryon incompatibility [Moelleriella libera RCEF 2490]